MFNTTLFENTDDCYKVLFELIDELLDSFDDRDDFTLDDFAIATFQFMHCIYNAKWDFILNYRY